MTCHCVNIDGTRSLHCLGSLKCWQEYSKVDPRNTTELYPENYNGLAEIILAQLDKRLLETMKDVEILIQNRIHSLTMEFNKLGSEAYRQGIKDGLKLADEMEDF